MGHPRPGPIDHDPHANTEETPGAGVRSARGRRERADEAAVNAYVHDGQRYLHPLGPSDKQAPAPGSGVATKGGDDATRSD